MKVASIFWLLPSSYNYLKGEKIDWRFLLSFALDGLVGVYLGVLIVLHLNQRILKAGVGIFITSLVIYMACKKDAGIKTSAVCSRKREPLAYGMALPMESMKGYWTRGMALLLAPSRFTPKASISWQRLATAFSLPQTVRLRHFLCRLFDRFNYFCIAGTPT
jgi:uncharacterized membrane protein YfcA